jgi:CDP-diacylglycerol--glycerol-3-phosphate 3-phosphatidyltransferase
LDVSQSTSVLRHLPNAISIARLVSTPVLVWLAWTSRETAFTWLLIAALASDAVDGMLARAFGWTSSIGSLLDSVADAALMLTSAYGVWVFHPYVFTEHGVIIWTLIVLWALEHLVALFRYRRLSSFHTALVRYGVLVFSVFLVVLFLFGFIGWLFYLSVMFSLAAVLEQLAMIALLPQWTPDLRGGLPEVLRRRTGKS